MPYYLLIGGCNKTSIMCTNKMGFKSFEECFDDLNKNAKKVVEVKYDYDDDDEVEVNEVTKQLEDEELVKYTISKQDYSNINKKLKANNHTCHISDAVIVRVDNGKGFNENQDPEEDFDFEPDDNENYLLNPIAMFHKAKHIAMVEAFLCN